jgi:tetratricopeptide (TPR) repeat protein
MKNKNKTIILIFTLLLSVSIGLKSESIDEMDRKAQDAFDKKDYKQSIALWLSILDIDPENDKIQKKIEMVYELKQKKDITMQRSKKEYREAREKFKSQDIQDEEEFKKARALAISSFDNYITAYRIDPFDKELQDTKENMQRLEEELRVEEEKQRMSRANREKRLRLMAEAIKLMNDKKYPEALKNWDEILSFFSQDKDAEDGKRKCQMAIDNKIKFEKITNFLAKGKELFLKNDLNAARIEFVQVLSLDARNRDARDYVEQIDEKLEATRMGEQRKQQAENLYQSGIENIRRSRFDEAQEDFENSLAFVRDYKDAKERIKTIPELKKQFQEMEKAKKFERINREFQDGLIALSEGRYKDAIAAFDTTLAFDPKNERARGYLRQAKEAQSLAEEEVVDENSPYYNIINTIILSGKKLYNNGQFDESRKNWNNVLKLFPKNKIATEYLLRCELKLNPEAFKTFSKRLIDEGNDFLKKNQPKQALKKFEMIKSISPDYPGLDKLIAQTGNVNAVIGAGGAGGAAPITPAERDDMERRYRIALNLYQQGGKENSQKALAELQNIARRDPDNIKAVISANKIEAELRFGGGGGDAEGGGRRQLTADQKELVKKYYYSGISYYSNNNFNKAVDEWRKVLAIEPDNIKAKNNIRKTLVLLGKQ